MKKSVFFDLYGTLIDIKTDEYDPWVYSVMSRYLTYHSVNISPDDLRREYFAGIRRQLDQSAEAYAEVDVYNVFRDMMIGYGNKRYSRQAIVDTILLYRSLTIRQFKVFEGVYDALVPIGKKYKTAIISDAQWTFSEPEISKLGLDRFFRHRVLSSRFGFKKPDGRLFAIALEKVGARPEDAVYIGDNFPKDLVSAKNAGLKFLLFGGECRTYDGVTPDGCFYDYSKLKNVLKSLF